MSNLWVKASGGYSIHERKSAPEFGGAKEWTTLEVHHPEAKDYWSYLDHEGDTEADGHILPDGVASSLTYADHGDHVVIHGRHTHPDFRGMGLATHLQDEMERRTGGRPIRSVEDTMSADGWDFRDSYRRRNPQSAWEGHS